MIYKIEFLHHVQFQPRLDYYKDTLQEMSDELKRINKAPQNYMHPNFQRATVKNSLIINVRRLNLPGQV